MEKLDIVPAGDGQFHILHQDRSFHAQLLQLDFPGKRLILKINGNQYEVQLLDQFDQTAQLMGLTSSYEHHIKEIRAPMPGMVLDILIEEGTSVHRGTPVLILEAMKMENIIKSPGDGVISRIHIRKGQAVDKAQTLLELE